LQPVGAAARIANNAAAASAGIHFRESVFVELCFIMVQAPAGSGRARVSPQVDEMQAEDAATVSRDELNLFRLKWLRGVRHGGSNISLCRAALSLRALRR